MALHPEEHKRHVPVELPVEWDPIRRVLEENKDWYRDLVEHSHDLLCVHDLQGRFLSVNPGPARVLGYTTEEILHTPMRDFIDPRFRDQFDAYLREIAQTGESHGLIALMTRSGEQRIWEYHNTLRTEGVPTPIVRGIAHDVTERVRADKALRATNEKLLKTAQEQERVVRELSLFRALLDRSNAAIEVIDPDTMRFLDVNERLCVQLGYSREELLSMTVCDINPKANEVTNSEMLRKMRASGFAVRESVHRRKDGSTFPVEVSGQTVRLDREYVVAVTHDITERKQYEDRLREFERVVENLDEMILVVNRDYRYVIVNQSFLRYWKMTQEEVVGRLVAEVMNPRNPEVFETVVKEKLDECFRGTVVRYALRNQYPGMGERDVSITYLPVEGPAGIDRVACVLRDITEQKQAEQALQQSESRERARAQELEKVLDAVPVPVMIAQDAQCRHITANRMGREFFRLQPDANASMSAPAGEKPQLRVFRDGVEIPADQLPMQRATATERPVWNVPATVLFEDGTERHEIASAVPLFDEDGKVRGAIGVAMDVTERKRTEEGLRASEERLRLAQEVAMIGTFERNLQTGASQWSPEMEALYGLAPGEFPKSIEAFLELVHADDRQIVARLVEHSIAFGDVEGEWRVVWPNGSVHWIAGRWSVFRDEQGRPSRILGMDYDITARKQVEEALRQSEERFRVALKNSPIAVFNQDRDLRYTWVYNALLPTPVTPGMNTRELSDLFEPEEADRITAIRKQVLETGVGVRHEIKVRFNGKKQYFDMTIEPVLDASGVVVGLTGAGMDITKLRETSDALREAQRKLTEEKLYLEEEIHTGLGFGEIIGQSQALQLVMENVSKVAGSDATVLLLGETGTGKELVARAIHRLSQRAHTSFIKMNCAAIPSGLLESELFGNEKGAFTGAVSKKIGRLELADKGTLFLDEIGEISLALQPKLLRVLQDHEFERLGGTHTLKADFRLIAATNRDLADSIREKEFRSDLYYRLNVFPIRVPALRERREDIPLLVDHFVKKFSVRMKKAITSVPMKTMNALRGWEWPGNVRELENFIERSVILTHGSVLVAPLSELAPFTPNEKPADESLEAAEREHILRALRDSHGQIGGLRGAAMRLGLKRTTLQSKLKHLGIHPRPVH